MKAPIVTLTLLLGCVYTTQGVSENSMTYQAKLLEVANKIVTTPELQQEWDDAVKDAAVPSTRIDKFPQPIFDCEVEASNEVPTSVHKLRPSDVKVVAAYGDSITAGNGLGAGNAVEVALENRGESWSIGGDKSLDEGVITLPNVLRKFNPDVKGASTCYSQFTHERYSWMNLAEPGGASDDLPPQSDYIIERMQNDPRIDFDNDWKVLTMFVGGNDLCASCRRDKYKPDSYRDFTKLALDKLHDRLPRAFVNLVAMFDLTPVRNMTRGTRLCDLLHWQFCDCVMNDTLYHELHETQQQYYFKLKELVDSGRYDTRDNFTVVLQPHMKDMPVPKDPETGDYDIDFVSYDCFHPSRVAHQGFAYMLWQNMLIPVGKKPCTWDVYEQDSKFFCPSTEYPYFFTSQNSNVTGSYDPPKPAPYC